jgi:hypothetical protein
MQTQATTRPERAPRKLTLKRETLRRLTPAELRLAAGGAAGLTSYQYACSPTYVCWTRHG